MLFLASITRILAQSDRSEIVNSSSFIQLNNNKLTKIDTITVQINERMGDNDARINLAYSKGDKVSIEGAWIEDMNGNIIRKIRNSEINDQSHISDFSLYQDDFVKWFELKHNIYPYRIVYITKGTYNRFLRIIGLDYTSKKQSVKSQKIVVEIPIDERIKYSQRGIDPPRVDTLSKSLQYTWQFSFIPLKSEINSSWNNSTAPKLIVQPLNFKYGMAGSWESWQTFGNWIYGLNEDMDDLPLNEKQKIDNLLKDISNPKERARTLYHYMQDYNRYVNIKLEIGGLQAYPASYVCNNRYGDCKALSNYMKSILNYAGIKSYYTLIDADDEISDINIHFPSQVFNHAILTVPFENDTIYLECTNKNIPFGYVHSSIQGRKGLLIDKDNSCFTEVPPQQTKDVLCSRNLIVNVIRSNYAEIELKTTLRGKSYEFFNYLMHGVEKNAVNKYIQETILSGTCDLIDYTLTKEDRDTAKVVMSANCKTSNALKKYGNNLLIRPFTFNIPIYESPNERKTDLQIDYPQYNKDTITYQFDELVISKAPDNVNIETEFGNYTLSYYMENDNKLIVQKSLLIKPGRYNLHQYKDFYEFITHIRELENKTIYVDL